MPKRRWLFLSSPGADWAMQVLADHADDEVFLEFKSIIDDLEPDQ
ncbi:hypothetical protein [Pseudomonas paeninsulae]|nr:hypothetical protein [Pseudomonas sp. IT1137]